jgi:glycosyltransferase involved in cell wall biosynthesis
MRILIYCKDYHPLQTGFGIAFTEFCEGLARSNANVEVTVVTPSQSSIPDSRSSNGVPKIIRLSRHLGTTQFRVTMISKFFDVITAIINTIFWGMTLRKLWRVGKYDMLFFESADDLFLMAQLSPDILKKTAIRFHSTGDTETARFGKGTMLQINRWLIRRKISKYCRVIFATNRYHLEFVKSFYFRNNPYSLSRIYFAVIPNAVELSLPSDKLQNDGQRLGQQDRPVDIVTLGRMDVQGVAQKGFADLFFAMASLPTAVKKNLRLFVVGDGPKAHELREVVSQLSLENVTFTGRLDNTAVRSLLVQSDVIALVSRFEGQSVFAIEGLLCGCAPLFTNTGALTDMAGTMGWRVPVQDVGYLADALTEISTMSRSAIKTVGINAREYAEAAYNPDKVAKLSYLHLANAQKFLQLEVFNARY